MRRAYATALFEPEGQSAPVSRARGTVAAMTTTLRTIIDDALAGRRLLEHPFYRRWEEGRLSRDELTAYAEQYRHFEAQLPATLTALADELDGDAREAVLDNLRDETGTPTHLELFEGFASHYGARDVAPTPAMTKLLAAYGDALASGPAAGLAGVLAYEAQGAEIAETKAAGLREFYGASDEACEFWRVHGLVEDSHAAWLLAAGSGMDDAGASAGARLVADAWWAFLDERESVAA
jgi:pyrroloquinoline-quinone synthase